MGLKGGERILGLAESFYPSVRGQSILAGIIMRLDLIVDGLALGRIRQGGNDATEEVIRIFRSFQRNDINYLLINGSIMSLYNIIDLDLIYSQLGVPVLCINTRAEHDLQANIRRRFPRDFRGKLGLYNKLGQSVAVDLPTGKTLFLRQRGLEPDLASAILGRITLQGNVPEPIRIAKIVARVALRFTNA